MFVECLYHQRVYQLVTATKLLYNKPPYSSRVYSLLSFIVLWTGRPMLGSTGMGQLCSSCLFFLGQDNAEISPPWQWQRHRKSQTSLLRPRLRPYTLLLLSYRANAVTRLGPLYGGNKVTRRSS